MLESGCGGIGWVDRKRGRLKTVATTLPDFTRGLAFADPFAFVGVSHEHQQRGIEHYQAGELEQAAAAFRRALALQPDFLPAR